MRVEPSKHAPWGEKRTAVSAQRARRNNKHPANRSPTNRKSPAIANAPEGEMTSTFTCLEAHDGCRALFNHVNGWAYIGPAGQIDPEAHPGTVSFSFNPRDKSGTAPSAAVAAVVATANPRASTARHVLPGDGVARKTNEVLSAYLDGADLTRLLKEGGHFGPSAGVDGASAGALPEGGDDLLRSRKGLPIVLTLQAILAGAKPSANTDRGTFAANDARAVETDADGPPRVSDPVHFPPLRSPELFLAPPIVVKPGEANVNPGVSCSQAVAEADAVAAATGTGNSVEDSSIARKAGGGVSRVGWWLRWAIAGNSSADDVTCVDDHADSTVENASYEMRGGLDGWQVVSVDTAASGRPHVPPTLPEAFDNDESTSWCDLNVADITGDDGRPPAAGGPSEHLSEYAPFNVPPRGTFRDKLMAPTSNGAVAFSNFSGLSSARQTDSKATTVPRLVEESGTYLWKRAAAGKVGQKSDEEPLGDEDPYYARKRVGAFAFRTKPRGKAHK